MLSQYHNTSPASSHAASRRGSKDLYVEGALSSSVSLNCSASQQFFYSVHLEQRNKLTEMILAKNGPQYYTIKKLEGTDSYVASNVKLSRQLVRSLHPGEVELNGEYVFIVLYNEGQLETRIWTGREGVAAHTQMINSYDTKVLYAGTVMFIKNELITWTNRSGSFQPLKEHYHQAGFSLEKFQSVN